MSQIQNIKIEHLHSNPANPRKNLGDLTDLAASIKANGVMQNLTVVPQEPGYCTSCNLYIGSAGKCEKGHDEREKPPCSKWESKGNFIVVIGHRRLAAAKLAGLEEVPCVISDMDEKQQIATMLLENIQRDNLTLYEEAQGFQMMLNLGDTVSGISEQTGISKTTIYKRVNMLTLDNDKFQQAVERGATIYELVALDKIKDIDRKNEVLEKAGTDNFKNALQQALDRQDTEAKLAPLLEKLSEFATKIESGDGMMYVKNYSASNTADNIEVPEDAGEVNYFYIVSGYGGWIYLYKERVTVTEDDETKARREAQEAARKERVAQLEEISKRAYKLRLEFVKDVPATKIKKNLSAIVAASVWERMDGYVSFEEEDFCDLFGIELLDSDSADYDPDAERTMVVEAILAAPERALFFAAYCDFEDCGSKSYFNRYYGTYSENPSLDYLYDLLEKLGYKMSDEEKAMRDGTHELFKEQETTQ